MLASLYFKQELYFTKAALSYLSKDSLTAYHRILGLILFPQTQAKLKTDSFKNRMWGFMWNIHIQSTHMEGIHSGLILLTETQSTIPNTHLKQILYSSKS